MASLDSDDSGTEDDFTLDSLPLDCIICVCEFLPPEDLARFSRVCKLFLEATQIGYLWRRHSLVRWTFCDVLQIPEGPNRWKRYFVARRRVEARIDQGRPGKDFRVKTLRGHESSITSAVVIGGGGNENWENPKPPLVVSLSADGNIKAWDVLQAKPVWSLDGENITCLAADERSLQLATGKPDGSITLWDTQEWVIKGVLYTSAGGVTAVKFGAVKNAKLPKTILMAYASGNMGGTDQIEVWDPAKQARAVDQAEGTSPVRPLMELWAPLHSQGMHLSGSGLLSLEARGGDVHIWDLPALIETSDAPPLPPHVTLHTPDRVNHSCWITAGCLATQCGLSTTIDVWDVMGHLNTMKKAGRSLYDNTNIYNPIRTIPTMFFPTTIHIANGFLITGDQGGNLQVLNPTTGECLQSFTDHKAEITDLYTDNFRVLSCSKDFSIRVYRWVKPGSTTDKYKLESRYTLLGGSVAHKTHDGFNQLLCEMGSCVGIAGNQLKFYTFSCRLDNS